MRKSSILNQLEGINVWCLMYNYVSNIESKKKSTRILRIFTPALVILTLVIMCYIIYTISIQESLLTILFGWFLDIIVIAGGIALISFIIYYAVSGMKKGTEVYEKEVNRLRWLGSKYENAQKNEMIAREIYKNNDRKVVEEMNQELGRINCTISEIERQCGYPIMQGLFEIVKSDLYRIRKVDEDRELSEAEMCSRSANLISRVCSKIGNGGVKIDFAAIFIAINDENRRKSSSWVEHVDEIKRKNEEKESMKKQETELVRTRKAIEQGNREAEQRYRDAQLREDIRDIYRRK